MKKYKHRHTYAFPQQKWFKTSYHLTSHRQSNQKRIFEKQYMPTKIPWNRYEFLLGELKSRTGTIISLIFHKARYGKTSFHSQEHVPSSHSGQKCLLLIYDTWFPVRVWWNHTWIQKQMADRQSLPIENFKCKMGRWGTKFY